MSESDTPKKTQDVSESTEVTSVSKEGGQKEGGMFGGAFSGAWSTGNWLGRLRPKLNVFGKKADFPENLWENCPSCGQLLHHQELKDTLRVCGHCGHHLRLSPTDRFDSLFDNSEYGLMPSPKVPTDPLKFRDNKKYPDRLKEARTKTTQEDAVVVAHGKMGQNMDVVVAVQNFDFMGGSMGMAAGEAIVNGARLAIEKRAPFVVFSAAGGARMQEGILSLMQMARTTVAVEELRDARLPFVSVMTDPTTGGVTASYAMLGDVNMAEPASRIGFAGRRVIEQTVRETLPEGFQRAEFLYEHGMLDMIVPRKEMRDSLIRVLAVLMKRQPRLAIHALPSPDAEKEQTAPAE